jgi:Cu(I)/Ag(I) efflux system membrane fusion protein
VSVTTPACRTRPSPDHWFIDPNLKEMTRSAKVRVELPNPLIETNGVKRRELYHKLYADAIVQVEVPEVLAVPRSAVLSPGAVPIVYVDQGNGAYEQRKVRLGRAGDNDYEMLDGLEEGERVVTQGNMLIDAQAQLHASSQGAGGEHQHGGPGPQSTSSPGRKSLPEGAVKQTLPTLTESQSKAVKDFLTLADAITASLAADNLDEFKAGAQKTHGALPALSAAFENASPWRPLLRQIETSGHLSDANDLKAARKIFHPLSEAVVEFAKVLRQAETNFSSVKIFRCPMTKDAFPGAPRTAEWIQMQSPIRNPYFGAEMLDCGSEVK